MSKSMSVSTLRSTPLKNAKLDSPPLEVRTGAADRPNRSLVAAPHCSADSRHSRRVSVGRGVQAVAPPVPVDAPPVPADEPPVPVDEPPVPVDEPPVPVDEPPAPVDAPPAPLETPVPPLPGVEPPVDPLVLPVALPPPTAPCQPN